MGTRKTRQLRPALTGGILLALTLWARADSEADKGVADRLLAEGERLAKTGDYAQALERFQAARSRFPGALVDCYIGLAYARLERWPEAYLVFQRSQETGATVLPGWCERGGKLGLDIAAQLQAGLFAAVEIQAEPMGARVRVVGVDEAQELGAPVTLWLPLGTHTVVVEKIGYVSQERRVSLTSSAAKLVQVLLEPQHDSAESQPSRGGPAVVLPPRPPPPAPAEPGNFSRGPWPWVSLSLGAAGLAAGVVLHRKALGTGAAAADLPPGAAFDEKLASFERERALALGAYAISAVATGVFAYLFLGRSNEPERSARLWLSPAGQMWVYGEF